MSRRHIRRVGRRELYRNARRDVGIIRQLSREGYSPGAIGPHVGLSADGVRYVLGGVRIDDHALALQEDQDRTSLDRAGAV